MQQFVSEREDRLISFTARENSGAATMDTAEKHAAMMAGSHPSIARDRARLELAGVQLPASSGTCRGGKIARRVVPLLAAGRRDGDVRWPEKGAAREGVSADSTLFRPEGAAGTLRAPHT